MTASSKMSSAAGIVDEVMRSRRAVRRYAARPVPALMVREILDVARHAPSASNIQPWKCHVLAGDALAALTADAVHAFRTEFAAHGSEYEFFPAEMPPAYFARRAGFGAKFGAALKVDQADMAARMEVMASNFRFFDAPVGIIFTIDRRLETASFIDYGCFLQSVMLAARARGLDSCAQQTWAMLHKVVRARLAIPDDEMILCGMAMGFADPDAPENRLGLDKEEVGDFAAFHGETLDGGHLLDRAA